MITLYSQHHSLHQPRVEFANGAMRQAAETPSRVEMVRAEIDRRSLGPVHEIAAQCERGLISRVHTPELYEFLQTAPAKWRALHPDADAFPESWPARGMRYREPEDLRGKLAYYCFDASTPLLAGTFAAAACGAQCALEAARLVLGGERVAFSLSRPPGHHAGSDFYGGYCYFNNAAIAAQSLVDRSAEKVAILDVDFHHGNGTQQIFYSREDVLFVSLHGDPAHAYPYFSGYADEVGEGVGVHSNLNIPLPIGTAWPAYAGALQKALEAIARFAPAFLVVSLGVDTYRGDPISAFAFESQDYRALGRTIADLGLPAVVIMEGGYAVGEIGVNVANFLESLQENTAARR